VERISLVAASPDSAAAPIPHGNGALQAHARVTDAR
jgi:hypothetical protein